MITKVLLELGPESAANRSNASINHSNVSVVVDTSLTSTPVKPPATTYTPSESPSSHQTSSSHSRHRSGNTPTTSHHRTPQKVVSSGYASAPSSSTHRDNRKLNHYVEHGPRAASRGENRHSSSHLSSTPRSARPSPGKNSTPRLLPFVYQKERRKEPFHCLSFC